MPNPQHINISAYDYALPDERIAKFPLPERDASKLLIFKEKEAIRENIFSHISENIPAGSLMIFNNTKVIQARLVFHKKSGARVEIFCLEPVFPADYALAFQQTETVTWLCMVGNLKKWKEKSLEKEIEINGKKIILSAEIIENKGLTHHIKFSWKAPLNPPSRGDFDGSTVPTPPLEGGLGGAGVFSEILENTGELPIPPYLHRETCENDKETYQTVYSKIKGSVAAPTAGLHFTETVFNSLKNKNIQIDELTLHVGAGTFHPVKSEQIANHEMHSETFSVRKTLIENILKNTGKIIAVGTTSVRSLESLYYIGLQIEENQNIAPSELHVTQWQPYLKKYNLPTEKALQNIIDYMQKNGVETLVSHTQIIIAPGFEFRIVSGIVTNFHQPKSTLLLLVSAFVGERWREIYDYALAHDFRFLSYGDSSILLK